MTIAEITQRIAQIQSRFGAPIGVGISPTATSFADSLHEVSTGGGSGAGGALTGPTDGTTGEDAFLSAEKYLGVPYKFGGTHPESGLDCSGFVQRAYADLGIQLPRVAKDQATQGIPVPSLSQAQPGDLLAFGSPVSHIGIYAGDGRMIVAPHTGDKVKIEDVYTTPTAIRRLLPPASGRPAGGSLSGGGIPGGGIPGGGIPGGVGLGGWGGGGAVIRPPGLAGSVGHGSVGHGSVARGSVAAGSVAPGPGLSDAVPYAGMFRSASAKYGVPAPLLAAVAKVESGFNPNAVSGSGAKGLMQIMPATAGGLGIDPLDPPQAIDGAARLLSQHLKTFGSVDLALAAYNAGGGAVRKYNGIPPYAETQAYVPKVRAAMAALGGGGSA